MLCTKLADAGRADDNIDGLSRGDRRPRELLCVIQIGRRIARSGNVAKRVIQGDLRRIVERPQQLNVAPRRNNVLKSTPDRSFKARVPPRAEIVACSRYDGLVRGESERLSTFVFTAPEIPKVWQPFPSAGQRAELCDRPLGSTVVVAQLALECICCWTQPHPLAPLIPVGLLARKEPDEARFIVRGGRKNFDGVQTKLLSQPREGLEDNESIPRCHVTCRVGRLTLPSQIGPTHCARAELAHALFRAPAVAR